MPRPSKWEAGGEEETEGEVVVLVGAGKEGVELKVVGFRTMGRETRGMVMVRTGKVERMSKSS